MLDNLLLINNLDGEDILGDFVPNLVNLSEATNSNIAVRNGLEVVLAAFALLAPHNRGRQEKNSTLDVIHLVFEFGRNFNRGDYSLLFLLAHLFKLLKDI